MKKVKYTNRKPSETDWYFCYGKGNRKAIIYYFAESDEWDYSDLASNHFNDNELFWIDESSF
jgi:hypothetical protein